MRAAHQLIGWFTNRKGGTAVERYERLAVAHEMLVIAAFLEASEVVTKRLDPSLELDPTEDEAIADEAGVATSRPSLFLIRPRALWSTRRSCADLSPARCGPWQLPESPRGVAALDEEQIREVETALSGLPERSIAAYRAQYLALAADVPEFLSWIAISADQVLIEHAREASAAAAEQLEVLAAMDHRLDVDLPQPR